MSVCDAMYLSPLKYLMYHNYASQCGEFSDVAHLVVPDVPAPSLNPASEGELWRRVGEGDSVSCTCIFLRATAQVHVYCMIRKVTFRQSV